MVKIFVPAAVKLFGEHSVVYGKPAISAAINKGVYVECEKSDKLSIETAGYPSALRFYPGEGRVEAVGAERFFAYINAALRLAEEKWGGLAARFYIKSELPPGAGAATSAAVSIGLLKAYALCAGGDVEGIELAKMGHRVELEVQGIASPMDSTTVTLGGVLKIKTNPFSVDKLNANLPPFYIAFLPRFETTGEIVRGVKALLERRRSAAFVIEAIGRVVEEAEQCLLNRDLECVGELMGINNWLLGALGVVDERAINLLNAARPFIYGGKISGAGRGGAVILLPRSEDALERVLSASGYVYHKVTIYEGGVTVL